MLHVVEDDVSYVWLNREKMQEDLPILNITDGTLSNKLTSLRNMGLIQSKQIANKAGKGTRTYYSITELTSSLLNEVVATSSLQNEVVDPPVHSKMKSNNKLIGDKELSNSVSNETPDEPDEVSPLDDDVASKVYSADEFLGCRRKNKKKSPQPPKKNLYQKCRDANSQFSGNAITVNMLDTYLQLRLSMHDKPIRGVEQWQAMLDKLSELSSDDATDQKIIKQSIERGWAAFFPLDDKKRSNYRNTGDTDASGNKSVTANKIRKEEDDDDETDQIV